MTYKSLPSPAIASVLLAGLFSLAAHGTAMAQEANTPGELSAPAAAARGPVESGSVSNADTSDTLPTTPDPQQSTPQQPPQQTRRILGIVPNFRAVSTTDKLPPQTIRQKFMGATQDSFDYTSFVLPAVVAAYDLGTNATPEFQHGAIGYGRYFWHSAVDQTSENYFVEFFVPAATHQDTRFYTLRDGSAWHKAGYALSRAVVTRTDKGTEAFNISEVLGSGMSAALSNAYYPGPERTFGNTGRNWGLDVGIDAATFVFREFWPDINRAIFHK